ncbi:hypothetical protein AXA84_0085 [Candidatus Phytoplasma oryzae]|uniref:Uncharacterized protein n=1 Tax=Candidatus Phytoplasma oryzae TaxID=203274 RepID=A0A139JRF7_9MOLU|nr:hypothetical protein [Candidatus Phytoplasma oryzae]KXT29440.1 hypothetical protein AXA84_0085 [Candidatus Phytoplasma oryzae]RAM58021.1 hypothetical protein DH96_00490 [Candidatus Phytoplasma oryzae]
MKKIINLIVKIFVKIKNFILNSNGYIITQYHNLINIKKISFNNVSSIIASIKYLFLFLISFIHIYFLIIIFIFLQDILKFFQIIFNFFYLFFKKIFYFLLYLFIWPYKIIIFKKNRQKEKYYLKNKVDKIIKKEIKNNLYFSDKKLCSSSEEVKKNNE